jgi:hypothetical protein
MDLYDVFEETELKAHFALSDEGGPTWDTVPEEWGSPWMQEAIQEGLLATIIRAPCEAAWYYGGLTIRPQRTATEAEARPHGLGQR